MALLLTADQRELQETVRSLLEKRLDTRRVRDVQDAASDFDREAWGELVELGATSVLVPEEHGGLGLGLTEASVVVEEAGRAIAPVPLHTALLATAALLAADDEEAQADLLPRIAVGEVLVALAVTEDVQTWIPERPAVTAVDGKLSGTKRFVRDGQFADSLLVLAEEDGRPALFVVETAAKGVSRLALSVLDRSVYAAEVAFDSTPARKLQISDVPAYLDRIDAVASVLVAAAQYGAYQRSLEIGAEYARDRFQFGRSIGSFQGVKHPLADWATETELAYSLLRQATALGDAGDSGFRLAALTAQVKLQGLSFAGGVRLTRVHGGIGYTWEHDAHLYLKQAKTSQLLLGTPGNRAERLATALGL